MGSEMGESMPKTRAVGHTGLPDVLSQTGLGAHQDAAQDDPAVLPGHSWGRRGPSPIGGTWAGWVQGQTSSVGGVVTWLREHVGLCLVQRG